MSLLKLYLWTDFGRLSQTSAGQFMIQQYNEDMSSFKGMKSIVCMSPCCSRDIHRNCKEVFGKALIFMYRSNVL